MHDRDQQHSNPEIKRDATMHTYTRITQAYCDNCGTCMHTRHLIVMAPALLAAVVLRPYLSAVGARE